MYIHFQVHPRRKNEPKKHSVANTFVLAGCGLVKKLPLRKELDLKSLGTL
jgi:hypothetical protein